MKYNVKTIRDTGLEARWTRTRTGTPIIAANSGEGWYVITAAMWKRAEEVGIRQAFEEHTAFGKFFSIHV